MKNSQSLKVHALNQGKWTTKSKVPLKTKEDLALYYTPGIADPCQEIAKDKNLTNTYTNRGNTIAIISDGSAVLGLGNIGAEAALPVMEGKAILFKEFGNVDAVPIVLKTQDPKEIITTIQNLAPSFGGINLEDISAPRCFEIENELKKTLPIPVFHDDQHGTAIVVTAALINAAKLTGKKITNLNALVIGVGASGNSTARMIKKLGIKRIYGCDSKGLISKNKKNTFYTNQLLEDQVLDSFDQTDNALINGFYNTDIVIGLARPHLVSQAMIKLMNKDPWVFGLANPIPEIMPKEALAAGAKIVGTGRADFDNQVNNLLAFPGLFRGVLDTNVQQIDEDIKMIAAKAIAEFIPTKDLKYSFILPSMMDKKVHQYVAQKIVAFSENRKK